jgi:hypothetical protein
VGEIQPQEWAAVADGSTVLTADGQELGTVRESLPSTLHIKAPANLLSDVEMYVPRAWVAAADGTTVRLSRSKAELGEDEAPAAYSSSGAGRRPRAIWGAFSTIRAISTSTHRKAMKTPRDIDWLSNGI